MKVMDVGFLATEMASHLRAGAPYERAWQQSLRAAWEEGATGGAHGRREGGRGQGGRGQGERGGGRRWPGRGGQGRREPGREEQCREEPRCDEAGCVGDGCRCSRTEQPWWRRLSHPQGARPKEEELGISRDVARGWELPEAVAAYARPMPRPRGREALGALGGGWHEWLRYIHAWVQWWWARSPAAQRQRRAVESLGVACAFSGVLGAPLADILARIGRSIDSDEADEEARDVASAGPAASAHILNAMPLLGVAAAGILGAEPLVFFTSGVLGALVGVVGVVLMLAGNVVSARMVAHARGRPPEGLDPALACDLVAAGLEAGAAIPRVLQTLGEAGGVAEFDGVARALVRGEAWHRAWRQVPDDFAPLGQVLQAAWEDGVSPVPGCERAALRLRQRRATQARRQAARLNVRLVVPLGVFMLPSFIALGVVPLVVALVQGFSS